MTGSRIASHIDTAVMVLGRFLALGAIVTACACSPAHEAAIAHVPPVDPETLLGQAELHGATWSVQDVTDVLGDPVRLEAQAAGGADSLRTLRYYGLEVGLEEAGAASRVAFLALTDPRYTAPEGIRVGWAEGQVLQLLGSPERREDDRWMYGTAGGRRLVVFVVDHAVQRIEWRFGGK